MKEQGVDEFLATTLTVLENINLDPVFDYSQADEAAQKIIIETFNSENVGKELSDIISQNQLHEEDLIYTKSGIFDHHIHDNELSTSKVGINAIEFCKRCVSLPLFPGMTKDEIEFTLKSHIDFRLPSV